MRYQTTVDLWDRNTAHMVRTGQLKLQAGQWVRCGQEQPSRFVKMEDSGVSLLLTHRMETLKQGLTYCAKYI